MKNRPILFFAKRPEELAKAANQVGRRVVGASDAPMLDKEELDFGTPRRLCEGAFERLVRTLKALKEIVR